MQCFFQKSYFEDGQGDQQYECTICERTSKERFVKEGAGASNRSAHLKRHHPKRKCEQAKHQVIVNRHLVASKKKKDRGCDNRRLWRSALAALVLPRKLRRTIQTTRSRRCSDSVFVDKKASIRTRSAGYRGYDCKLLGKRSNGTWKVDWGANGWENYYFSPEEDDWEYIA